MGTYFVQIVGQEFGDIGVEIEVGMGPGRAAPVNQVHLEPPCAQIANQTALGKQIIDQHVDGQGRHDYHGGAMSALFYRDHFTIKGYGVFGQWRVITQAD